MNLNGKVAIITGGGTGIGEAMAKLFAQQGVKVAVTGRRKDVLEGVVKSISQEGGEALALPGSVTEEADVQEAVRTTERTFGRIDILVNNAGNLFHAGPLHEFSDQVWEDTVDIFLNGTFRFKRAVIPRMVAQGGGAILNISTVAGLKAIPGFPAHAYAAAKAGVIMLTKTVAVQYAKDKIRCNCICPAGVETPGVASVLADPKMRAGFDAMHPIGRMGQPIDVAQAGMYLVSDVASWITGTIVTVDGGVSAL